MDSTAFENNDYKPGSQPENNNNSLKYQKKKLIVSKSQRNLSNRPQSAIVFQNQNQPQQQQYQYNNNNNQLSNNNSSSQQQIPYFYSNKQQQQQIYERPQSYNPNSDINNNKVLKQNNLRQMRTVKPSELNSHNQHEVYDSIGVQSNPYQGTKSVKSSKAQNFNSAKTATYFLLGPNQGIQKRPGSALSQLNGTNLDSSAGALKNTKRKNKQISVKKEKELLYEEIQDLKVKINNQQELLTKKSTQNSMLQKENRKMNKVFDNVDSYIQLQKGNKTAQPNDTSLIVNLKKQIKEQSENIQVLEKDLDDAKKASNYTRIKELEIENKAFQDENIKLKSLYQHALQDIEFRGKHNQLQISEEKYYLQNSIINSLQQENEKLESQKKLLDDEIQNFEVTQELDRKLQDRQKNEINDLKQEIKKLDTEIGQYKNQNRALFIDLEHLNENNPMRYIEEENQNQKQEIEELQASNNQKTSDIEYLTSINKDFKIRLDEKLTEFHTQLGQKNDEVQNYKDLSYEQSQKIEQLENEIQFLKAQEQKLLQQQKNTNNNNIILNNDSNNIGSNHQLFSGQNTPNKTTPRNSNVLGIEESHNNNNLHAGSTRSFSNLEPIPERRKSQLIKIAHHKSLATVKTEDVKMIGLQLNYYLRSQNIEMNEILDTCLFSDENIKQDSVSVSNLQNKLINEPFSIKEEQDALLISRYLVEDNDEDYIVVNTHASANLILVKSRFKFIIGQIQTFTEQQEEQLLKHVSNVTREFRLGLEGQLNLHSEVKQNQIASRKIIKEAIDYLEMPLNEKQQDFWFYTLFQKTNQVDQFPLEDVLYTFDEKPQSSKTFN